jgi:GT2 family glycosyltransferase
MEEFNFASPQPSASILLINYNGWDDLSRCLPSVIADAMNHNYEILVVDNCSTDDSVQKIIETFPQVRLIRNSVNGGFGMGNNIAAHSAKGKYLAFLNADTIVEKDWLEELIKALQFNPQIGMATSKILLMSDPNRINACGNNVHLSGLTLCRGAGQDKNAFSKSHLINAVSGAAFIMRKDLFHAVGGFDDMFFMYMEDTDLSLRTQLAGRSIQFVPSSIIYHDYTLTFGPLKTFYQERNRYLMLLKNFRLATLLVLSPILLLAEIISWGYILLYNRTRFSNKLQAYLWLFQHYQEIQSAHRNTQLIRRVQDRKLLSTLAWQIDFEQTGENWISQISHVVFDTIFFLLRFYLLAVVWW